MLAIGTDVRVLRRLAFAFGRWNRRRKAEFALRVAKMVGARSVLLVGVSGDRNPVNNLIEDRLENSLPFVVASGIVDQVHDWKHYVIADGRCLPFGDGAFDLVYSNAVIEHVGDATDQQRFVDETARVGRTWIITTPNRWFPVEAHEHTLLTHWRADWAPRDGVTRLLGVRDLRSLLPSGVVRGMALFSPTLTAVGGSLPYEPTPVPNPRS